MVVRNLIKKGTEQVVMTVETDRQKSLQYETERRTGQVDDGVPPT